MSIFVSSDRRVNTGVSMLSRKTIVRRLTYDTVHSCVGVLLQNAPEVNPNCIIISQCLRRRNQCPLCSPSPTKYMIYS
jgi:hypothetical protein